MLNTFLLVIVLSVELYPGGEILMGDEGIEAIMTYRVGLRERKEETP